MEKFTKGDWFSALDGFVYSQDGVDCEKIAGVMAKNILPSDEEKANLDLIAAAPEMYQLLNRIAELSNGDMNGLVDEMLCTFDEIDNLLAKARGE